MGRQINDIKLRKDIISLVNQGYTQNEIFKKLNIKRSLYQNIKMTFSILDINKELKTGEYSKEEIEFIKNNLDKQTSFLIKELNRDYESVNRKRNKMIKDSSTEEEKTIDKSIKSVNKRYSEEEIEFVREAYERGDSLKEISIALDRTISSVKSICSKCKIYRKNKIVVPEGKKRCPRCKEIKSIESFGKDKNSKDGHDCYCRTCKSIMSKKYKK